MAKGVAIDGIVFHGDPNQDLDHKEFLDEFIDWLESKGLIFGGTMGPIDENGDQIESQGDDANANNSGQ